MGLYRQPNDPNSEDGGTRIGMNSVKSGVCFVSSLTVPASADPAAEKRWRKLARDYNLHVICFSSSEAGYTAKFGGKFFFVPKRMPFLIRVFLYYFLTPFVVSKWMVQRKIQVLIAQSVYEAGAVVIPKLLFSPFMKTKLIVEAHGDWIESMILLRNVTFGKTWFKTILRLYSKFIFLFTDGARSVSDSTRTLINQFAANDIPHETFPAYMDLEPFFKAAESDSRPDNSPYIMYAGALTDLKGVDVLIKSFAQIANDNPHLSLVIAGRGSDRADFEELSQNVQISKRVIFTGHLPNDTLAQTMAGAELFVLPSRKEGYGRVLIEAMASKTPVIATQTAGANEIIKQSKTGILVEKDDVGALANNIQKLLADPERRQRLAEGGHRHASEHFNYDSFFKQYRDLIGSVLEHQ